ncbi:MAG: ubiquinone/menaquinone biosynthesis methyltransferase [Planctomycetota bacterium]
MSETVKHMFSRIAGRYDLLNRLLSARSDVRWRRRGLRLLAQLPQALVLDLAAGTHDLGLDALRLERAGRVIGADFCLPMLQAGCDKIHRRPVAPLTADALRLPLADASVDRVLMAYGWRNLDDPAAGIREIRRVLHPGGDLLILEFFRPTGLWPRLFYGSFGRVVFPLAGGLLAGDAEAYRYLRRSITGFYSRDEATSVLESNGFTGLRWHSFAGGISHAVAARACGQDVPPC